MITIHLKEEQDFISEFFKNQKVSNDVWIGVKYTNKRYEWNDGSDVVYKNWAPGSPKQKDDHCVQFDVTEETLSGKWSDVVCSKDNLVVCQKTQKWTFDQMQKILTNVMKNPVPIDFIYVQLPHQKEPVEIWPWMIWENVSKNYSGVFFRVEGDEAAPFGQIQMANTTRIGKISGVNRNAEVERNLAVGYHNTTVPLHGQSKWFFSGGTGGAENYVSFELTGGEVRPKNMAMKIWRRIS